MRQSRVESSTSLAKRSVSTDFGFTPTGSVRFLSLVPDCLSAVCDSAWRATPATSR
eukprot:m.571412 g.571412  ORF g.571412 m.571412 type:complete len:56 (+) comp57859_c0_seq1:1687-1854(+)